MAYKDLREFIRLLEKGSQLACSIDIVPREEATSENIGLLMAGVKR